MAESARRRLLGRRFDMRELWRVGLWGVAAAIAVTLAAMAVVSDTGTQRIVLAHAPMRGTANQPPARTVRTDDRNEVRELTETVRTLAADRDRLLVRLGALERNVGDLVTGSINRQADAIPPATLPASSPMPPPTLPPPQPPPQSQPAEEPPSAKVTVNVPMPRPAPRAPSTEPPPAETAAAARPNPPAPAAEPPAAETVAALRPNPPAPEAEPAAAENAAAPRTEFGIDLGGAPTLGALRALWASARSRHGAQLEGLRPVVSLREHGRARVELRLVAGPFGSAATAARACSALTRAGALCQPALFEGQRLPSR